MTKASNDHQKEKEVTHLGNRIPKEDFFSLVDRVSVNFKKEVHNRISLSETMSLHSHLPEGLTNFGTFAPKKLTARQCLAIALMVNEFHPEKAFLIREHIAMLCYLYQYEGLWRKVHKILKLTKTDMKIFVFLEEIGTPRELFGNLIQLGLEKANQFEFKELRSPQPVYPQRKRGYNDHGSRRDDSKWLPTDIHLGPNPEKKDFRNGVGDSKRGILNFLFG